MLPSAGIGMAQVQVFLADRLVCLDPAVAMAIERGADVLDIREELQELLLDGGATDLRRLVAEPEGLDDALGRPVARPLRIRVVGRIRAGRAEFIGAKVVRAEVVRELFAISLRDVVKIFVTVSIVVRVRRDLDRGQVSQCRRTSRARRLLSSNRCGRWRI